VECSTYYGVRKGWKSTIGIVWNEDSRTSNENRCIPFREGKSNRAASCVSQSQKCIGIGVMEYQPTQSSTHFPLRSPQPPFTFSSLCKSEADLAADGDDPEYETEHDARRRAISAARDPVHSVDLRAFFQRQMSALAETLGREG